MKTIALIWEITEQYANAKYGWLFDHFKFLVISFMMH